MQHQSIIQENTTHCANCGHETSAPYCPECGQRKQERFTFSYILEEAIALLNYDRGLLKNFLNLTTKPTATILSYLNGKTKSLYPPLSYFLTCMTLFLILVIQLLEAEGWSSGKTFVFDDEASKKEIHAIYAKEKDTIEKKIRLADTLMWEKYKKELHLLREQNRLSYQDTKADTAVVVDDYFAYTEAIRRWLETDSREAQDLEALDTKVVSSQVFVYTIFYFTPFYLAFITFVLYYTKKLYLTEHLIIQMFITAQIIVYISFAVGLFKGIEYVMGKFFVKGIDLASAYPTTTGIVWLIGLLSIMSYYFYLSITCYKQSWWLVLLKCIATAIILTLVAVIFFAAGNLLITGKNL
jgi:hypothetical protein